MVNALRTLAALRVALDADGLVRTSDLNGAEMRGWLPSNVMGSTGFSLRAVANGEIEWHLVISGKKHLRYCEYEDTQDEETYELHKPENPEILYPRIKAIFSSLGITATSVQATDWQNMWDDDVGYTIRTNAPAWLERPDPENRWRMPGEPVLVTLTGDPNSSSRLRGQGLIGYAHLGKLWITRETIDHLIATLPVKAPSSKNEFARPSFFGARRAPSDFDDPAKLLNRLTSKVTNHWDDEVKLYPVFDTDLKIDPRFKPSVPFMMGGELRSEASFVEIDAQFGDETPWKVEPTPALRP